MNVTELEALLPSWLLALGSANRSPNTITTYSNGVKAFLKWCRDNGHDVMDLATAQLWVTSMLENGIEPTTAKGRMASLRLFSKWLFLEGEQDQNPLADMPLPKLHKKVTDALTDAQVSAMLRACQGKSFTDRRDEALIRFMVETTARAAEALAVQVEDVNLAAMTAVIVKGKGAKGRVVPISTKCAAAIDRYLRMRRRLGLPDKGPLWVGDRGRTFGYYALRMTLHKRAAAAGVENFHPHLTRHTAATRWLRNGGSEAGLMAIAGWTDRAMLDRYTSASATERALDEARKLNLGDF